MHIPASDTPHRASDQASTQSLHSPAIRPSTVFLADGCGAILAATSYCLMAVFAPHFGLPRNGLLFFAGLAVGIGAFSLDRWRNLGSAWEESLRRVIYFNCIHAIWTMIWFSNQLSTVTVLGVVAMTIDWIVLLIVVAWEWKMLKLLSGLTSVVPKAPSPLENPQAD